MKCKFRGKSDLSIEKLEKLGIEHKNGWVHGYLVGGYIVGDVVEAEEEYCSLEWWVPVEQNTIGQYTGLKDKNGKEIYEGDIIEYKDYSRGVIIFGGEQPKSKGVIEIENLFDGVKYLSGIGRQKGPDVEVVGNIYVK